MKLSKGKKIAVIILSISIVLSLCGITVGTVKIVAGSKEDAVELHQTDQVILEGDGTQIVQTEKDAYDYFVENADSFGIIDAENTLSFSGKSEALGNHYYNYKQVYEGIPVYGNQLIAMTDSDGIVLMSSGVYKGIDKDVDLTPSATKDILTSGVKDYLISSMALKEVKDIEISAELSEEELVIYAREDAEDVLAYEFDASFSSDAGTDEYHVIADADSGKVLTAWSNLVTGSKKIQADDLSTKDTGVPVEINVYQDTDGLYYMYDKERNIVVYDAGEKQVNVTDPSNLPGSVNWREAAKKILDKPRPKMITSDNNTDWSEESVTLMNNIAANYDWYKLNFGISGFNNDNGLVMGVYDDAFDNGENAYSCACKGLKYTLLSYGFREDLRSMDLIAHEYGHSAQKAVVNLSYSGETGAIMEAFADVMGEIVEGDSSWKHSTGRNLANPKESQNPSKIKGRYFKSAKKFNVSNDWGYVHQNSTILSHASYLMCVGMDGDRTKNLNNLQIAQLWYLTIKNISKPNINFQEFGTLMRITAKNMAKTSILKDEQYDCVVEALSAVGITANMTVTVNTECKYFLKDFYGTGLEDVKVKIYEIGVKEGFAYPENDTIAETTTGIDGGVELSVENDKYYRIVISDNKYPQEPEYELNIHCSSESDIMSLDINTVFRSDVVTGFEFMDEEIALAIGEEGYIDSFVKPFGIYNRNWEITWSSSDNGVAEVDKLSGAITGKAEGTATIRATLDNNGKLFSCEAIVTVTKKQRDTVLVLDRSGSMAGTPLQEMKQSAINFCKTLLKRGDNQIEIIGYDDSVEKSGFLNDFDELEEYINNIYDGSTTNMYEALCEADYDLQHYGRINSIQNIVVMSDGIPNRGDVYPNGVMTRWCNKNQVDYFYESVIENGNAVCVLADDLKEKYNIYSLGFFHSLIQDEKKFCSYLMKYIQNKGYYEVDEAEELQFTFDDISDEVKDGSKIVIQVACPVDVTVTCGKEMLSSTPANYKDNASFGSLQRAGASKDIKVLELDSDKEYQVSLNGTGSGTMDYSITYYSEDDSVSDNRTFQNVPITADTQIRTDTTQAEATELAIDSDGDGEKDSVWTADANKNGTETWTDKAKKTVTPEKVEETPEEKTQDSFIVVWIVLIVICGLTLMVSVVILIVLLTKKGKSAVSPTEEDNVNSQEIITAGIQLLDGMMRGMKIPLEDNVALKVGKDPNSVSVVIDKRFSGVSRVHCSIVYSRKYNKYFVMDYSSNGTYLENGTRLRKREDTPVERQTIIYLAKADCRIKLL